MDNTQNNILTLDMYEDLKEEIIKALKSEVSKSQGGDNAALTQKIEEIAVHQALNDPGGFSGVVKAFGGLFEFEGYALCRVFLRRILIRFHVIDC